MDNTQKKYALTALSALGVFGFIYAVRSHYSRLMKKRLKESSKCSTFDTSSDNISVKEGKAQQKVGIPEDLLEKMVEKIKNSTIHNICIILDKLNGSSGIVKLDKTEDNKETAEEKDKKEEDDKDIVIEDNKEKNNDNEDKEKILIFEKDLTEEDKRKYIELASIGLTKHQFLPEFEKELYKYHPVQENTLSCKIICN